MRLSHIQRLLADYVMAEQLREALVACQNYFKHRTTPKVLSELLGLFFRGFFVILFSEFSEFSEFREFREFSADAKKIS